MSIKLDANLGNIMSVSNNQWWVNSNNAACEAT